MNEYANESAKDQARTHTSGEEKTSSAHTRSRRRRKGNGAAPSSAAEQVAAALGQARDYLRPRLVLPKGGHTVLVLWAAHTHYHKHFAKSPRLGAIAGAHGSGKSSVLDAVEGLSPNPDRVDNTTAPSIFRAVDASGDKTPTILLDEAEHYIRSTGAIAAVLNAWSKRGAWIRRTDLEAKGKDQVRRFYCYCPIAYASNVVPHPTLADRSILFRMRKAEPEIEFEDDEVIDHLAAMREVLEKVRLPINTQPAMPEFLKGRAKQRWLPLFSVAEALGPEWVKALTEAVPAFEPEAAKLSVGEHALLHIKAFFVSTGAKAATPGVLVDWMMDEFPDQWDGQKPLTTTGLRQMLDAFNIPTPNNVRAAKGDIATKKALNRKEVNRGYARRVFEPVWERYTKDEDVQALLTEELAA